MMARRNGGLAKQLRYAVLGPYVNTIARLDEEIARLHRTLADPDALRPLVTEALHREVQDAPTALAGALAPVVDELLRARSLVRPQRPVRRPYWPWLTLLTAAGAAGLLLLSWRVPAAMVSATTGRALVATGSPASVAAAPIREEPAAAVFGLGETDVRDEELARTVGERLSTCDELAGATVRYSVRDGWVWLRGQATANGRDAAERALAQLGTGVVVVNQLAVTDSPVVAAR